MRPRENCHRKAVSKIFVHLLKRVRIKKRTLFAARRGVLQCIELSHNPKRKHANNCLLSAVEFEVRQHELNLAGVREDGGISIVCRGTSLATLRYAKGMLFLTCSPEMSGI